VEVVAVERQGVDLLAGVLDPDGVGGGVEFGADGESGGGGGGADQVGDDLVAGQGQISSYLLGDFTDAAEAYPDAVWPEQAGRAHRLSTPVSSTS